MSIFKSSPPLAVEGQSKGISYACVFWLPERQDSGAPNGKEEKEYDNLHNRQYAPRGAKCPRLVILTNPPGEENRIVWYLRFVGRVERIRR